MGLQSDVHEKRLENREPRKYPAHVGRRIRRVRWEGDGGWA